MVKLILRAVAGRIFGRTGRRNRKSDPDGSVTGQNNPQADNAALHLTVSNAEECRATWKHYFGKPKNQVAFLTLVAVSVYTGITALQYGFAIVSSHQQLRAYVGTPAGTYQLICQGCAAQPGNALNGTYEIRMLVKNFGTTPAMKPRTCAQPIAVEHPGAVDSGDLDQMQRQCADQAASSGNQTTIWPGDAVPVEIPFGPDAAITSVRRGLSRAFVLGYTTYRDIFGSHHTSWYCAQYKRDGQQDVFTGCDRTNLPADF